MSAFAFVAHDAGGTIPPLLAVCCELVSRGHGVRVLAQPCVQKRAEAVGAAFHRFSSLGDYRRDLPLEEQVDLIVPAIAGDALGRDLLRLMEQDPVDVVIVDANLAGAMAAAEAAPAPSAVLLHSLWSTFTDVWFADVWPLLAGLVNATQAEFGLSEAQSWSDVFSGHHRLLSVVPREFDPAPNVPGHLRHCGFLVPPAPNLSMYPTGDAPTVLVSFSTTLQHQDDVLAEVVDVLASMDVRVLVTTADHGRITSGPRIAVVDFVPHASVLPETDLVVSHGGLGTVAAAMHAGVPMVCVPFGRDQFLNAQQIARLGAGIDAGPRPSRETLRAAVDAGLRDPAYRQSARALAAASNAAGGPWRAANELERLADLGSGDRGS